MARVSEAVARPVRGAGQSSASLVVIDAIDAFGLYNFTPRQYGASVLLLALVFSFLQAVIENALGKGFLREIPPKDVPVVSNSEDDGLGHVDTPVQTDNGPRPEDGSQDDVNQDPDFVPPIPEDEDDLS